MQLMVRLITGDVVGTADVHVLPRTGERFVIHRGEGDEEAFSDYIVRQVQHHVGEGGSVIVLIVQPTEELARPQTPPLVLVPGHPGH